MIYSDRHVVMTSSEDSGEVLPLTESAKCNLSAAEAYEYLTKAGNVYKKLTCLSPNPPVQPRGGSISLSTVVLNSRDRQGMYGMQHFRAPINKPHNSL